MERELALGWTQVQDAHGTWGEVDRMRRLYRDGKLKIRIYKTISGPSADATRLIEQGPALGEFDGLLTVRAIKVVMDGALGSRGAALLAPYSDDPKNTGLITTDTVALKPMLAAALRSGIQVWTHSIGDRGNRLTLDFYEQAMKDVPADQRKVADPRWRDEHSQIVNPDDIPRFKQLGVIASMQPSHAISDLYFAPARLGLERLKGAYAWQSFIKQGTPVPGGSDAPVERGEPMIEFYAAVARKDLQGRSGQGWHPEEKMTRAQALKAFTIWPAFAAFEEDKRGYHRGGEAGGFHRARSGHHEGPRARDSQDQESDDGGERSHCVRRSVGNWGHDPMSICNVSGPGCVSASVPVPEVWHAALPISRRSSGPAARGRSDATPGPAPQRGA